MILLFGVLLLLVVPSFDGYFNTERIDTVAREDIRDIIYKTIIYLKPPKANKLKIKTILVYFV